MYNNEVYKAKENARQNFIEMTRQSWTYNRMTDIEKKEVEDILKFYDITGNYDRRWKTLQNLYSAFLVGLGYNRCPATWRDEAPSF